MGKEEGRCQGEGVKLSRELSDEGIRDWEVESGKWDRRGDGMEVRIV